MALRFLISAVLLLVIATGASHPAAAQDFARSGYFDVTKKRSIPKVASSEPLVALRTYLKRRAELNWGKTVIEVLVDKPGRRIYRVVLVCKSVEACADDSVAGTREAFEIVRGKSGWNIVWIGSQIRCWKGRGHQDWSTVPCT